MRPRFKYLPREFDEYVLEDLNDFPKYEQVENPFPNFPGLPDGEYMVRGDRKEHRKEYWKVLGMWFLIDDVKKDNGHFYCDSAKYELFPSLPESEWKKIESVGWKRLSPVWRRHLWGRQQWIELRRIGRDIGKDFIQINKEFPNES